MKVVEPLNDDDRNKLNFYEKTLEKLARLGGIGGKYGNSIGNEIALAALNKYRNKKPEDLQCPICGYYCLGKGGLGCIDKPFLTKDEK